MWAGLSGQTGIWHKVGEKAKVKKWNKDFENPWDNGRTWNTCTFWKWPGCVVGHSKNCHFWLAIYHSLPLLKTWTSWAIASWKRILICVIESLWLDFGCKAEIVQSFVVGLFWRQRAFFGSIRHFIVTTHHVYDQINQFRLSWQTSGRDQRFCEQKNLRVKKPKSAGRAMSAIQLVLKSIQGHLWWWFQFQSGGRNEIKLPNRRQLRQGDRTKHTVVTKCHIFDQTNRFIVDFACRKSTNVNLHAC